MQLVAMKEDRRAVAVKTWQNGLRVLEYAAAPQSIQLASDEDAEEDGRASVSRSVPSDMLTTLSPVTDVSQIEPSPVQRWGGGISRCERTRSG